MTRSGARILVGERSPTVAAAIAAWLRGWGMEVAVARTVDDIGAALAASSYDLAVIDHALAGCDMGTIPVLTVLPATDPARPGPFLNRPVHPDALRAAIEACLGSGGPGLDVGAIEELWGGVGTPGFRRVAQIFLSEAPGRVAAIVMAHTVGDQRRLGHEAHALAGAAVNVGTAEVTRLARAIETAASDQSMAAIAPLMLALQEAAEREFDALATAIGA
jgi:HPt (histidine-containing phosphotransfer) domain-containing protein